MTDLYPSNRTLNGIGNFFDLLSNPQGTATPGESMTGVVNAVSSGTNIQWTQTAGGTVLEFISGRSPAGGWTLDGTITFAMPAQESLMTTNIGMRARVYRRTDAGVETEVGGSPFDDGIELTQGGFTLMTWTGNPTAIAFAEDDRLVVRYFITNIGTMGTGTGTLRYNALLGAGTEAQVTITETVAFKSDATNFGDIVGTSIKGTAAITDPLSPSRPITISVGDLVFVAVSESGGNTSVACTDDLGNSYTALNGGTNGIANVKAFFSVATTGGDCTPAVDTTASANNSALEVTVFKGPFASSPLDINTTSASDSAEPYTATATGTLAQSDELIVGYFGGAAAAAQEAYISATPSGAYIACSNPGLISAAVSLCVTSLVVASTSSVTMGVSAEPGGARATACVVATFKREPTPAPSADSWFRLLTDPPPPLPGLGAAWQNQFGYGHFTPPPEEVTVDKWFAELSGPTPPLPGLVAANQIDVVELPFIETIFPDMWFMPFSDPTPSLAGLLAPYQEEFGISYFIVEEVTVDKWFVSLSEPLYALSGLGASYQVEFGETPVEDSDAQGWFYPFSEPTPPLSGLGSHQQLTLTDVPFVEDIFLDMWFAALSEPTPPLSGLLAPYQAEFGPAIFVEEEVTVDKWFAALSEPLYALLGQAAPYQDDLAAVPFEDSDIQGWFYPFAEPTPPLSGLLAQYQEQFGQTYTVVEEVTVDKWFIELSTPTPPLPGLDASQQLALTDVPFEEDIFVDMWFGYLSEPPPPLAGLLAPYQEEGGYSPFFAPEVSVDMWFEALSEPTPPLSGLGVASQIDVIEIPFIEDTFVDMWFEAWSDPTPPLSGLLAAYQEAFGQNYFIFEEITVDKWFTELSTPTPALSGLGESQQLALTDVPFEEDIFVDMWFAPFADPTLPLAGLLAQYQEEFGYSPLFEPTVSVDMWFETLGEPTPPLSGLGTANQIDVIEVPFVESIFVDMWFEAYSEPTPPLAGLRAQYQSELGQSYFVIENITVDKWFSDLSKPTPGFPGLGAEFQSALSVVPFIETITVDMWFSAFSTVPPAMAGAYYAAQQEFGSSPFVAPTGFNRAANFFPVM